MHPAFLYLPDTRLSIAELAAARIDGHVVELGDAYIPADLVEGAHTRAANISHLVQSGAAASGPSAAWIHGAGDDPPARHHISRAVPRRIRPVQHPRVVFHDSAVARTDVQRIDTIDVTTIERTIIDLALGLRRDPLLERWLESLAHLAPDGVDRAAAFIATRKRLPGSRRAVAALDALRDLQDEVTR